MFVYKEGAPGNSGTMGGEPSQGGFLFLVVCAKHICLVVKEGTDRTGSILKAGLHLRPDYECFLHACSPSQWALNFVSSVYGNGIQMEHQIPWDERAAGVVPA